MIILRFINVVLSRAAILLVRGYQLTLSRVLPRCCRFTPSCSQYMIEAICRKGFVIGTLKGILRLLRCNPFFRGGHDPVR
jgi:putative membrane protein insertion efficiency factor